MSLRAEAYEKVRDEILRGGLEVGARTSEREIAEQRVGMSRTPVREALAVLVATGVLDQTPQVGVEVRRIGADQALRAVRLRAGMEPVMAEELAGIERDLSELRAAIEEMGAALEASEQIEFMLADTRFHAALARLGGFDTSVTGLQGLRDQVHLFRLTHPLSSEEMQAVIGEHWELLVAFESRDRPRAVAAATGHLAATRERIEAASSGERVPEDELAVSR